MMKMDINTRKKGDLVCIVAMFMIYLIIFLPVASSSVLSATITDITSYGSDEIPGYRARTDVTIVDVTANVPEDPELSTGQVKVLEDPTRPFECTLADEITGTFSCRMEYPETTLPLSLVSIPFTVQLFNDAGAPMSPSKQWAVFVDSLPPKVVNVDYSTRPGGVVEASFNVTDEACSKPECAGRCTGVSSIRFTVAGLPVGQASEFEDRCSQTGKVNLSGLAAGEQVVTKHICIEAADKLGQSSTECRDVVIDTAPPVVTGVGLVDINNRQVLYTNGQPLGNIKLVINITEPSMFFNPKTMVEKALHVNASEMSERPDQQKVFGDSSAPCTPVDLDEHTYTCSVSGLYLIATTPRSISVRIEAKDEHDNVLNETKTVPIQFDNTPPVATKIYSSFMNDESEYWVREENNTIFADISESGSGMSNRYVFLDFTGFGHQPGVSGTINLLAPNACDEGWTCRWNRISVASDKPSMTRLSLAPQQGSRDDANNGMEPVTGVMHVDRDEPSIEGVENLTNITGLSEIGELVNLSSGDSLNIHFAVKDHSGIKTALANFSDVIDEGPDSVEGECTEITPPADVEERVFDCVWEGTDPIKQGYEESVSIYFTFEDYVNHTVTLEKEIEILAKENETPDYWEFQEDEREISPEVGLDRLSWALHQPVSYQRIVIDGDDGVVPISFIFDPNECYSGLEYVMRDDEANMPIIVKMGYDLEDDDRSDDLYYISLNPAQVPPMYDEVNGTIIPFHSINITCPVRIISIRDTGAERSLTLEEIENITFYMPVFNNPLGQGLLNLDREILDAAENSWADQEWMKTVEQVFTVMESLCNILKTYYDIVMMVSMFRDLFGIACETTEGIGGWGCSAESAFAYASRSNTQIFGRILSQVYVACSFISCNLVIDQIGAQDTAIYRIRNGWKTIHNYWSGGFIMEYAKDALLNALDNAEDTETYDIDNELPEDGFKTPDELRDEAVAKGDAVTGPVETAIMETDDEWSEAIDGVTSTYGALDEALHGEHTTAEGIGAAVDYEDYDAYEASVESGASRIPAIEDAHSAWLEASDAEGMVSSRKQSLRDLQDSLISGDPRDLPDEPPEGVSEADYKAYKKSLTKADEAAKQVEATRDNVLGERTVPPGKSLGGTTRNPDGTTTVTIVDASGRVATGTGSDRHHALMEAGFTEEEADALVDDIPGAPTGNTWINTLVGDFMTQRSPDNFAISLLSGCISGIFKNIEEWRQIDCNYLICLREEVPMGKPVAGCKMEQDYNWCVVLFGNIFSAIPLVGYWDNIIGQIQKYLGALDTPSGWTQMVFKAVDTLCDRFCEPGAPAGGCTVCELKNWAASIAQIVADVLDLAQPESWKGAADVCPRALEGIEEVEERVNAVDEAEADMITF